MGEMKGISSSMGKLRAIVVKTKLMITQSQEAIEKAGLSAAIFAPGWTLENAQESTRMCFEQRERRFWHGGTEREARGQGITPTVRRLIRFKLPYSCSFNRGVGKFVRYSNTTHSAPPPTSGNIPADQSTIHAVLSNPMVALYVACVRSRCG